VSSASEMIALPEFQMKIIRAGVIEQQQSGQKER
jgi:hypothetical protein